MPSLEAPFKSWNGYVEIQDVQGIKRFKTCLEKNGALDKSRRIIKSETSVLLPVVQERVDDISGLLMDASIGEFKIVKRSIEEEENALNNEEETKSFAELLLDACGGNASLVPKRWELYEDLVLFGENCWSEITSIGDIDSFLSSNQHIDFARIAELFKCGHLAKKSRIPKSDELRRPAIVPLYGAFWNMEKDELNTQKTVQETSNSTIVPSEEEFKRLRTQQPSAADFTSAFWTKTLQNGVWYTWSPLFTMFCQGNISEKVRVASSGFQQSCQVNRGGKKEKVLDLYAGIGYWAFIFLKKCQVETIHACEWNPWSVEGLRRGAVKNKLSYKIMSRDVSGDNDEKKTQLVIYPGDNRTWGARLHNAFDRICLGLLPDSEAGWPIACAALDRENGGWMHVHVNLMEHEVEGWKTKLIDEFTRLFKECSGNNWTTTIHHVECVKSFAPKVYHYVADVECRPHHRG